MAQSVRTGRTLAAGIGALALILGVSLTAQGPMNPYRTNFGWDKIPGRKIGVPSGIKMDPDGKHLWILDRCGANGCADSELDPIIKIELGGKLVKSFGKGMIGFPHGFWVDKDGNVWATDGAPQGDPRGAPGLKKGIGHQIFKFNPDGKLLMTLGVAAQPGADETHFNGPTGVAIAANGDIWITDGHGGPQRGPNADNGFGSRGGNNRLVRYSAAGKFMQAWGGGIGSEGWAPMQFNDPHDLTIDQDGRIYVADRGNLRVQVISSDGKFITAWTQFGKPSAVMVKDDKLYVADGMSNDHWNPGWDRGIRIADRKTGWIKAFILDAEVTKGTGTEFLGIDPNNTIYSGAAGRPGLVVHELLRPY